MRLRERLLDLFFPPRCGVCGEVVASGEVFCPGCRELLLRTHVPRDLRRGGFAFSDSVTAFDYDERTLPALLRLKRVPDSAEAQVFAELLAQALRRRWPDAAFSAVVAVPTSEEKRRVRGFDHAEALARALCARIGAPLRTDLLLAENGASQHTLSYAQRFANAEAVYRLAPGASVEGRVLAVDDILTSGATLDRCAALLRAAGASDVRAAAAAGVAYRSETPSPSKGAE